VRLSTCLSRRVHLALAKFGPTASTKQAAILVTVVTFTAQGYEQSPLVLVRQLAATNLLVGIWATGLFCRKSPPAGFVCIGNCAHLACALCGRPRPAIGRPR